MKLVQSWYDGEKLELSITPDGGGCRVRQLIIYDRVLTRRQRDILMLDMRIAFGPATWRDRVRLHWLLAVEWLLRRFR